MYGCTRCFDVPLFRQICSLSKQRVASIFRQPIGSTVVEIMGRPVVSTPNVSTNSYTIHIHGENTVCG